MLLCPEFLTRGTAWVAKSGEMPALSRNCEASFRGLARTPVRVVVDEPSEEG